MLIFSLFCLLESGTIDFSEYIVILYRIITNPYSEGKGSMQEEFSFLDQDGNGFISVDDYRNAMAILAEKLKGVKVNIEGASYFFSKGDSDGDGQLNYEGIFHLIESSYSFKNRYVDIWKYILLSFV